MLLPTSVFSVACLLCALPEATPQMAFSPNDRVPFAQGLAEIYKEACIIMALEPGAPSVDRCIDDAVATVLKESPRGDYDRCDALGGMLVTRIGPCAEATRKVALLTEDSTARELFDAIEIAHDMCTAEVLCDGKNPGDTQGIAEGQDVTDGGTDEAAGDLN